ncbi:MAG: BatD family protein [Nitrospirota bacterium]
MKKLATLFAALLLFAAPAAADAYQVSMEAAANRPEVAKGESFTYTLKVIEEGKAEQPGNVTPPDFTGFGVTGQFTSSSTKVINGVYRQVTEYEYRMSSDLPGEHVISPATITLTDPKTLKPEVVKSNPVRVKVLEKGRGVLGALEGIRDIKAPKTFIEKVRLVFYALFAMVILVLFALAGLAIYMVRRKKPKTPTPATGSDAKLSARDEALAIIARAEPHRSDPKAFYSTVVEGVRQYLKAAYGIPAMEATTTEIMSAVKNSTLPAPAHDKLWALLGEADLVKFAKHVPTDEEMSQFIEKARGLVREI